jgi:hypothetical protein
MLHLILTHAFNGFNSTVASSPEVDSISAVYINYLTLYPLPGNKETIRLESCVRSLNTQTSVTTHLNRAKLPNSSVQDALQLVLMTGYVIKHDVLCYKRKSSNKI